MKNLCKIVFILFFINSLKAQTFPTITNTIRSLSSVNPPLSQASFSNQTQTQTFADSATINLGFLITNLTPAYLLNIQIGSAQDSTNGTYRVFKFIIINNTLNMLPNDSLPAIPYYLKNNDLYMSFKLAMVKYSNVKWITVYYTDVSSQQNSIKYYYQFN